MIYDKISLKQTKKYIFYFIWITRYSSLRDNLIGSFYYYLETVYNSDDSPRKKIDDLIHLAELCIELLQQDAEHYQEAFQQYR